MTATVAGDFQFWNERSKAPAAITFIQPGGDNVSVIGPLRLLTVDEQNAAGRAFVKFCEQVRPT